MSIIQTMRYGPSVPDGMPEMYTGVVPPDQGDLQAGEAFLATNKKAPGKGPKKKAVIDRSPAGLKPAERKLARPRSVAALKLMLDHAAECHYTEGSSRWSGISDRRLSKDGEYPEYSDCSSSYTWAVWNSLAVEFHKSDVLNEEHWDAGYTGTLIDHGLIIPLNKPRLWMPMDAIFYGDPISHVAACVGWDKRYSSHMVIDCGSEGGPYYLKWSYRSDATAVRRYI